MPLQPMWICQNLKAIPLDILKNEYFEMKAGHYAYEKVIIPDSLQVKMWINLMDVSPTK